MSSAQINEKQLDFLLKYRNEKNQVGGLTERQDIDNAILDGIQKYLNPQQGKFISDMRAKGTSSEILNGALQYFAYKTMPKPTEQSKQPGIMEQYGESLIQQGQAQQGMIEGAAGKVKSALNRPTPEYAKPYVEAASKPGEVMKQGLSIAGENIRKVTQPVEEVIVKKRIKAMESSGAIPTVDSFKRMVTGKGNKGKLIDLYNKGLIPSREELGDDFVQIMENTNPGIANVILDPYGSRVRQGKYESKTLFPSLLGGALMAIPEEVGKTLTTPEDWPNEVLGYAIGKYAVFPALGATFAKFLGPNWKNLDLFKKAAKTSYTPVEIKSFLRWRNTGNEADLIGKAKGLTGYVKENKISADMIRGMNRAIKENKNMTMVMRQYTTGAVPKKMEVGQKNELLVEQATKEPLQPALSEPLAKAPATELKGRIVYPEPTEELVGIGGKAPVTQLKGRIIYPETGEQIGGMAAINQPRGQISYPEAGKPISPAPMRATLTYPEGRESIVPKPKGKSTRKPKATKAQDVVVTAQENIAAEQKVAQDIVDTITSQRILGGNTTLIETPMPQQPELVAEQAQTLENINVNDKVKFIANKKSMANIEGQVIDKVKNQLGEDGLETDAAEFYKYYDKAISKRFEQKQPTSPIKTEAEQTEPIGKSEIDLQSQILSSVNTINELSPSSMGKIVADRVPRYIASSKGDEAVFKNTIAREIIPMVVENVYRNNLQANPDVVTALQDLYNATGVKEIPTRVGDIYNDALHQQLSENDPALVTDRDMKIHRVVSPALQLPDKSIVKGVVSIQYNPNVTQNAYTASDKYALQGRISKDVVKYQKVMQSPATVAILRNMNTLRKQNGDSAVLDSLNATGFDTSTYRQEGIPDSEILDSIQQAVVPKNIPPPDLVKIKNNIPNLESISATVSQAIEQNLNSATILNNIISNLPKSSAQVISSLMDQYGADRMLTAIAESGKKSDIEKNVAQRKMELDKKVIETDNARKAKKPSIKDMMKKFNQDESGFLYKPTKKSEFPSADDIGFTKEMDELLDKTIHPKNTGQVKEMIKSMMKGLDDIIVPIAMKDLRIENPALWNAMRRDINTAPARAMAEVCKAWYTILGDMDNEQKDMFMRYLALRSWEHDAVIGLKTPLGEQLGLNTQNIIDAYYRMSNMLNEINPQTGVPYPERQAILDAYDRFREWSQQITQDLIDRGKLPEIMTFIVDNERIGVPTIEAFYLPHKVIDYAWESQIGQLSSSYVPNKLKEPARSYLWHKGGSGRNIAVDVESLANAYSQVLTDNMLEDFIETHLEAEDWWSKMSDVEREAFRQEHRQFRPGWESQITEEELVQYQPSDTGTLPERLYTSGNPQPGAIYTITDSNGIEHEVTGYQVESGNAMMSTLAASEPAAFVEAIMDHMRTLSPAAQDVARADLQRIVDNADWDAFNEYMKVYTESGRSKVLRPVLAMGRKHRVYMIDKTTADSFRSIKEKAPIIPLLYDAQKLTRLWKSVVLSPPIGIGYHVTNFVGDATNASTVLGMKGLMKYANPKEAVKLWRIVKAIGFQKYEGTGYDPSLDIWSQPTLDAKTIALLEQEQVLSSGFSSEAWWFRKIRGGGNRVGNAWHQAVQGYMRATQMREAWWRAAIVRELLAQHEAGTLNTGSTLSNLLKTPGLPEHLLKLDINKLYAQDPVGTIGLIAREIPIDFLIQSRYYKDYIRGLIFPFITWPQFNLLQWSKMAYRRPEQFGKYMLPIMGSYVYNNSDWRRHAEQRAPDFIRNNPHHVWLPYGYDKENQTAWVFAPQLPPGIALSSFGLENIGPEMADAYFRVQDGEKAEVVAKELATNLINKMPKSMARQSGRLLSPLARLFIGFLTNADPMTGEQFKTKNPNGLDYGEYINMIMANILPVVGNYIRAYRTTEDVQMGVTKEIQRAFLSAQMLGFYNIDLKTGEARLIQDKIAREDAKVKAYKYDVVNRMLDTNVPDSMTENQRQVSDAIVQIVMEDGKYPYGEDIAPGIVFTRDLANRMAVFLTSPDFTRIMNKAVEQKLQPEISGGEILVDANGRPDYISSALVYMINTDPIKQYLARQNSIAKTKGHPLYSLWGAEESKKRADLYRDAARTLDTMNLVNQLLSIDPATRAKLEEVKRLITLKGE